MLERITPGIDKFYVACGKTDMRMGINGLVNKITTEFKLEPCENSAFLFCGIRKDRIKVLLWDGSGFILIRYPSSSWNGCFAGWKLNR